MDWKKGSEVTKPGIYVHGITLNDGSQAIGGITEVKQNKETGELYTENDYSTCYQSAWVDNFVLFGPISGKLTMFP